MKWLEVAYVCTFLTLQSIPTLCSLWDLSQIPFIFFPSMTPLLSPRIDSSVLLWLTLALLGVLLLSTAEQLLALHEPPCHTLYY